jgi:O-antigen ligase
MSLESSLSWPPSTPLARTLDGTGREPAGATSPQAPAPASDGSWDLLLACVAGYVLAAVGRVHQLFPVLQIVRLSMVAGVLAIALYLIDQRHDRRLSGLWTGPSKYLIALFVWMILSVPGAIFAGDSFDLVFGNFIKTVLMYFVLAGTVRGYHDIERLIALYLLAAVVYATVVLWRFDIGDSDWRLGHLYYYDSNDFATFAVTALPFGLYFAHRGRRRRTKLLALAGLTVLSVAFALAGSRGGFLALLATGVFITIRYTGIPLRTRLSALALVGLALLCTASEKYWSQMETILSDADYNRTEESGRLQIWGRGLGYMLQHPVLGVGAGNFPVAEGTLSPFADRQQFGMGVRWNAPHNIFVQVGAELGVPGLVLFSGMIASAFVALRRSYRANREPDGSSRMSPALTDAIMASLIAFMVGAFFLSLAYSEMLYTLIALAVAVQKVGLENVERGRPPLPGTIRS